MTSRSRSDRSPITPPPDEAHAALSAFDLAPERIHLNHGSFGAVPRSVEAEHARRRREIARDPTTFFQEVYPEEIRRAAAVAASEFGGAAEDWVFCENATGAVNSVLASLRLGPGDGILTTSHAYGAVEKAMRIWAERKGAALRIAELPPRIEDDEQIVSAIARCLAPRTRLLVVDHITSPTAIVFPVLRIAKLARGAGVPFMVDGAHAPGQIELDAPSIGADWYTGNAHKWFFAPFGCGLMWTAPERQAATRPAVLSHGADRGYTDAFDWIGTRDVAPWLCLAAAADAFHAFGGSELIVRNRELAARAASVLTHALDGVIAAPAAMRAAMVSLSFPNASASPEQALRVRKKLRENGVVAWLGAFGGSLCLRVSAQIYNRRSDYERCAEAFRAAARSENLSV